MERSGSVEQAGGMERLKIERLLAATRGVKGDDQQGVHAFRTTGP